MGGKICIRYISSHNFLIEIFSYLPVSQAPKSQALTIFGLFGTYGTQEHMNGF